MDEIEKKLVDLKKEVNSSIRNDIALSLMYSGDERVRDVFIEIINRDIHYKNTSTILFCLEQFDISGYVDVLVKVVVYGSWESSHKAVELLSGITEGTNEDKIFLAYQMIKDRINDNAIEEWRLDLLNEISSFFN